jgi:hypothetical protein
MKKLLLLSILPLLPITLCANVEGGNTIHETINKQIAEIKPPRKGVSSVDVARVQSPFLLLKSEKKEKKKKKRLYKKRSTVAPLTLESAINKNVKINGKWYKEGDKVRGYTIVKVAADEVLLKSNGKERTLYLNQKNDKIQFKVN